MPHILLIEEQRALLREGGGLSFPALLSLATLLRCDLSGSCGSRSLCVQLIRGQQACRAGIRAGESGQHEGERKAHPTRASGDTNLSTAHGNSPFPSPPLTRTG